MVTTDKRTVTLAMQIDTISEGGEPTHGFSAADWEQLMKAQRSFSSELLLSLLPDSAHGTVTMHFHVVIKHSDQWYTGRLAFSVPVAAREHLLKRSAKAASFIIRGFPMKESPKG